MGTLRKVKRMQCYGLLLLLLVGVISGCQSNGDGGVVKPPMPQQAQYAVVTPNYYLHYNEGNGFPPFPAEWQFADGNYPIPVSYELKTTQPAGINFITDTEDSIVCWNHGDPRTCIVSRTTPAEARINMLLEDDIVYNGQTNIIGLTTVESNHIPAFLVEIATRFNTNPDPNGVPIFQQMSVSDIQKTITHELGHTLGLGHSPDMRDLMYFQANNSQGTSYANFLTYGDAIALWTTFNARNINWRHLPAITQAPGAPRAIQPSVGVSRIPPRGAVVDVYTKQ